MRGVLQKYGRPRRNAQERLRGEISQCDGAHVSLEKVIKLTKELIGLTPGIESDNRTIARFADLYNLRERFLHSWAVFRRTKARSRD